MIWEFIEFVKPKSMTMANGSLNLQGASKRVQLPGKLLQKLSHSTKKWNFSHFLLRNRNIFSFFYPQEKFWGHFSKTTAPLHHHVRKTKKKRENERKFEIFQGAKEGAGGCRRVQKGFRTTAEKSTAPRTNSLNYKEKMQKKGPGCSGAVEKMLSYKTQKKKECMKK